MSCCGPISVFGFEESKRGRESKCSSSSVFRHRNNFMFRFLIVILCFLSADARVFSKAGAASQGIRATGKMGRSDLGDIKASEHSIHNVIMMDAMMVP